MTAMNAKRRICTALLVLLTLPAAQGQVAAVPDTAALRRPFGAEDAAAFVAPPRINYPQTWFHLIGGNVSAEGITEDFEAIARTGISGVQLFHGQFGGPWPGVDPQISALSPGWDALVRHAAREARRLGLRFTMQNCSGWATSGGPWIEPSNAMRHLAWSRTESPAAQGGSRSGSRFVPAITSRQGRSSPLSTATGRSRSPVSSSGVGKASTAMSR